MPAPLEDVTELLSPGVDITDTVERTAQLLTLPDAELRRLTPSDEVRWSFTRPLEAATASSRRAALPALSDMPGADRNPGREP